MSNNPVLNDLIGNKFGLLIAIKPERQDGHTFWICKCKCGNIKKVVRGNLTNGLTKSCGYLSHSKSTNLKRSKSCKKAWTSDMKDLKSKEMKKLWAENSEYRNKITTFISENNPMHNPVHRKKYNLAIKKVHADPIYRKNFIEGINKFWDSKKGKKIKTINAKRLKSFFGNNEVFERMQSGNRNRKGKPNEGARNYFRSLSKEEKRLRSENLSNKMVGRFSGVPKNGERFGKQGFVKTRFGIIRYDSGWERKFIVSVHYCKLVKSIQRDIPIRYLYKSSYHNFLVDFLIVFKNKSKLLPLLVEIKSPYLLKIHKVNRYKIASATEYAKSNNYSFRLICSRKDLQVLP